MFDLSKNSRYFFFPEPVNMIRGIDGLSELVCAQPVLSLVSGDIFVFFSRDRRRVKLLRWDGDGFILYYKRLTRGTFDLETIIDEVFPTDKEFDPELARLMKFRDSICYEYIPGKFIKRVRRQYFYSQDGTVY